MMSKWISVSERKPPFGEYVLVYCNIYGRYLTSYEEIDNSGFGEWHDVNGYLGGLPPVYWTSILEPPELNRNEGEKK